MANMAKTETFTLQRTGDRPVTFRGEMLTTVASANYHERNRESSNRQWFIVTLYRTEGGTMVALAQYRAGSRLGREDPKDLIFTGKDAEALIAKLKSVDAGEVFVTGWPGRGDPIQNRTDMRSNDASMRSYGNEAWEDVVERAIAVLTNEVGAEVIE